MGIDPDFLELVAKRTGLKFKHEYRSDWAATIAAFKAGKLDVLGSVLPTSERLSYMSFTVSYTSAPNVIITRADSPYLFNIQELGGRTIGVPRGYAGPTRDLRERQLVCKLVEYDNTLETLRAVALGEVYASIGDVANAAYLIKQNNLGNLRLGSIISTSSEIMFGIRKDWPELTSIVNKVIADISTRERSKDPRSKLRGI